MFFDENIFRQNDLFLLPVLLLFQIHVVTDEEERLGTYSLGQV